MDIAVIQPSDLTINECYSNAPSYNYLSFALNEICHGTSGPQASPNIEKLREKMLEMLGIFFI